MALMRCPECGKEISDAAPHCIHCGCPRSTIDAMIAAAKKQEEQDAEEKQEQENTDHNNPDSDSKPSRNYPFWGTVGGGICLGAGLTLLIAGELNLALAGLTLGIVVSVVAGVWRWIVGE